MCLSLALERPEDVLKEGIYKEYEWTILKNSMGFRCGYVRLPAKHPWYGDYSPDCSVYGGVNFAEADTPCGKGKDDSWWIGFDCGHGFDAPDPELLSPLQDALNVIMDSDFKDRTIKTTEYVENECKHLIDQAREYD